MGHEPDERPQPAPLSLPSSSSTSRIVEIVGSREQPLPSIKKDKHVHFTFFNDYREVPYDERSNKYRYYVVGEAPVNPRNPVDVSVDEVGSDPWMDYLREYEHERTSLFTREQYESQVNWMRGTPFEGANVPQVGGSSGSNDPLPQVPKAPMAVPMWTTFENAKSARGNFHWNPGPKERQPVP